METKTTLPLAAFAASFLVRSAVPTLDPIQGRGASAGGYEAWSNKRRNPVIEHDSVTEALPV